MKDSKIVEYVKMKLKNIQTLKKIDEGLQADIYELPYNDNYYAIKIFKETTSQDDRIGEIQASQKIKSKYIIVYVCHDLENLGWILYEKFGDYNLQQYLQYFKLQEYHVNYIFTQLIEGYHDIIESGYYHCDLKTANILVNSSTLEIKICDLGFANQIQQKIKCRRGSRGYFAPEFFQDDIINLNEKTEVFALGVILYQLLTNEFPYTNQNTCQKWIQITKSNWKDFWKNKRISQQYKEIIQNIFQIDPTKRCNLRYLQSIFHF
ncbi:unnamed protein product [Paramecium primaurelia]|uniref:Protein kinase domain-containing protein n=1 Tax=Paramecium primaurelia TaxID=5886 RepID=A0A8S1KC96_PARPR|nr:unnamed protein product [Paramecium primaurelia]